MDPSEIILDLQDQLVRLQGTVQALSRELHVRPLQTSSSDPAALRSDSSGPEPRSLYEMLGSDFRFTRVVELHLGDTPAQPVRFWKEVVVEVAKWVLGEHAFSPDVSNPVVARDRSTFPEHTPNPDSYLVEVGDLVVDTWGNVNTKVSNLIALCNAAGVDPQKVRVTVMRKAQR